MDTRTKRLRVALIYDAVYPYTLGGVEHRNHALALCWKDRLSVSFYGFAYWKDSPAKQLPGCRYVSIGAARHLHDASGKRRISDALLAAVGVGRALWCSEDDVWEIANIPHIPVIAAWVVSRLRRRPLIVTWHEFFGPFWDEYLGSRVKGTVARWIERLALRCTPHAIVVSPLTASRMVGAGFPKTRLTLIPNGVGISRIDAVPIDTKRPSDLIYAGRLVQHKRVDLAMRAFAELRRRNGSLTFRIIGDGPWMGALKDLAAQLGVEDAVFFDGFLDSDADVFSRMKSAKLAILPSSREGFGLTLVQAWACGLPAVVCRGAENAMALMIENESLGEVVDPTPEQLATACERQLRAAAPELRRARFDFAKRQYDEGRVAAAIADVLESTVRRR